MEVGVALSAEGPWELPVVGFEVLHVTFAFLLDLVACGEGGVTVQVRLEGRFDLTEPGGRVRSLDASEQTWEELTPVLALRRDRISLAGVGEDGRLRIEFASGRVIEAGPDESYENWEVSGPGFQLIALPGGGVAVFGHDRPGPTRPPARARSS